MNIQSLPTPRAVDLLFSRLFILQIHHEKKPKMRWFHAIFGWAKQSSMLESMVYGGGIGAFLGANGYLLGGDDDNAPSTLVRHMCKGAFLGFTWPLMPIYGGIFYLQDMRNKRLIATREEK